jgi:hypothetical protein
MRAENNIESSPKAMTFNEIIGYNKRKGKAKACSCQELVQEEEKDGQAREHGLG